MNRTRVPLEVARSAGGPRVRYIGFRLEGERTVERSGLIDAIRRASQAVPGAEAAEPWLTRFDGALGIVRCRHTGVEATRQVLASIDAVPAREGTVAVRLETLQTAGTIRSLTDGRLAALKDTGRRR